MGADWMETPFYAGLSDATVQSLYVSAVGVLRRFGPHVPSEDIASDAMIRVSQHPFTPTGEDPLESRRRFLKVTAYRLGVNYLERSPMAVLQDDQRHRVISLESHIGRSRVPLTDSLQCACESPEQDAVASERSSILRQAIAGVGPQFREMLIQHYLRGKDVRDIATEFGIPLNTVLTRLHRGRGQLRDALARDGYAAEDLRVA